MLVYMSSQPDQVVIGIHVLTAGTDLSAGIHVLTAGSNLSAGIHVLTAGSS